MSEIIVAIITALSTYFIIGLNPKFIKPLLDLIKKFTGNQSNKLINILGLTFYKVGLYSFNYEEDPKEITDINLEISDEIIELEKLIKKP